MRDEDIQHVLTHWRWRSDPGRLVGLVGGSLFNAAHLDQIPPRVRVGLGICENRRKDGRKEGRRGISTRRGEREKGINTSTLIALLAQKNTRRHTHIHFLHGGARSLDKPPPLPAQAFSRLLSLSDLTNRNFPRCGRRKPNQPTRVKIFLPHSMNSTNFGWRRENTFTLHGFLSCSNFSLAEFALF